MVKRGIKTLVEGGAYLIRHIYSIRKVFIFSPFHIVFLWYVFFASIAFFFTSNGIGLQEQLKLFILGLLLK